MSNMFSTTDGLQKIDLVSSGLLLYRLNYRFEKCILLIYRFCDMYIYVHACTKSKLRYSDYVGMEKLFLCTAVCCAT